jgi:excinuclease ABC subunit C
MQLFQIEDTRPVATVEPVIRPRPPAELRADVRAAAENRPGVYRMIGPGDRVLYIGKSIRVRTRLLSYFREPAGTKAEEIIRNTNRIEWDYAASEFGALLTEMKSIKRCRPPYNVVHKRDRNFCFIRLTAESAPRLQAVPRVRADGSRYYGPFAGPERVKLAVREIADALELRDCAKDTPVHFADQLDFFSGDGRVPLCLRADLGRCLAPCAARCTRTDYLERAANALQFLVGEADVPLELLRERMQTAVYRLNFEYAAVVRDRIQRLEEIRDELAALRGTIESLSFLYRVEGGDGDRLYVIRKGLVLADVPAPADPSARIAFRRRAERLLTETTRGLESVGAAEATEILMIARWFRQRPGEMERTWRPGDPDLDIELPA